MNNKYWRNFYKTFGERAPSPFCEWFIDQGIEGNTLVDMGAGNGRDAFRLGQIYNVTAVDPAIDNESPNYTHVKMNANDYMWKFKSPDIVYARFFLHAVPEIVEDEMLEWADNYIVFEARTNRDHPQLYKEHERRLIDPDKFLAKVEKSFDVIHFEVGTGLSPYRTEDPHLFRIIAKRYA